VSYSRKVDNTYQYGIKNSIKNTELENIESIKDLDVTFDSRLKINKADSILAVIKRNFTYLDKDSFLVTYYIYINGSISSRIC